jgi:hypothetical protein
LVLFVLLLPAFEREFFCSCACSLDIRELQGVLLSAITSVDTLKIRRTWFPNIFTVLLLVILFAACSQIASASSLEEGGRLLARQVVSSLRGPAVTYEQHNLSSLGAPELFHLETAFRDELQRGGVRILSREAAAAVVLTISANPSGYLGIAQIFREGHSDTFIESLGSVTDGPLGETQAVFTLEKEFLFEQDTPMLDAVILPDQKNADVLGLQDIYWYERQDDHWKLKQTQRLPVKLVSARDLSGFLFFGVDFEAAYLPGQLCTISMNDHKGWSCEFFREHAPVRGVSSEAFAKEKIQPWLSAAQFGTAEKAAFIVTGQDGTARLFEGGTNPVAEFPAWGGEIASIHNGCGTGWQLLVTGKADRTKADSVRAVEIQLRQARDVSSPLEMPGPVIELHTAMMRTAADISDNTSAIAIVRNLQTGRYEAYRLTITCGN